MSDIVDISVAITEDQVSISTTEVGIPEINAIPNVIVVNIINATTINPLFYDLSEFTNTSPDPFVQVSDLADYVPEFRTITINGDTKDLSVDRAWTVLAATTWGSITGTLALQTDLQNALNAKQNNITLTTTGSSGSATLIGATLNIPTYSLSGLGGVPSSRTLTINGTTYDLSADRSWTIATGLTVGTTAISSGTVSRILFEGTGNVLQESANLSWDNTTNILNLGSLGTNGEIALLRASTGTAVGGIKTEASGAGVHVGGGGYLDSIVMTNGSGIRFNTYSGSGSTSIERMRIFGVTGNIGINTTTDAGYKADINGSLRVNSSFSITSPSFAGVFSFTMNAANTLIANSSNIGNWLQVGPGNRVFIVGQEFNSTSRGNIFGNTVGGEAVGISNIISQSSGTTDLTGLNIRYAINNTSTYSGIVRGLYYNPTLTSLTGTIHRAIETVTGDVLFATTSGSLLVGTTTLAGFKLDVNGTARVQGQLSVGTSGTAGRINFARQSDGVTIGTMFTSGNLLVIDNASTSIELRPGSLSNAFSFLSSGNFVMSSTGALNDNASALCTMNSTTKGFLPPRMTTTEKNAIATPATGLVVYDTTLNNLSSFNGTVWSTIGGSVAWGSITGTLALQTDLQSALDAKVPYTGATANVDLGTHTLSSKDLIVNHSSGSGVAASITKGGSGEALTVVKSSGSGNAASITGGVTLLSELHLSTLLADSYIASASTWNAKQDAITLTTTGTSGPATLVGATLNIPQYGGGGGASIIKLTAQTLTAASWTLSGSYYIYTFSNVNITVNTRVDFTPDNSSYSEVTTCGMLPEVDVAAGSCTFYSLFPPQNDITGEITIIPTV